MHTCNNGKQHLRGELGADGVNGKLPLQEGGDAQGLVLEPVWSLGVGHSVLIQTSDGCQQPSKERPIVGPCLDEGKAESLALQ